MDNSIYTNLTRQDGLKAELQVIANNIANLSTPGFKREGVVFSEYVMKLEDADSSLSMAKAEIQRSDFSQGPLTQTNGALDFAIDGDGYFLIEFNGGQALTRAGNFKTNTNSELVTNGGYRVLDEGGSPIILPPEAGHIKLASDGTLSADGQFITNIGLYSPVQGDVPQRAGESIFTVTQQPEPVEGAVILQGFQEDSNVDAVLEVARMIEVHRAYETGANLTQSEDERIREVLRTLGS